MKDKVNTYVALLVLVLAGAGAVSLIIHLAFSNNLAQTANGNEAAYSSLQNSILNPGQ